MLAMIRLSPGVRRLCVCVAAPHPGLLDRACQVEGYGRLYTERIEAEGIDLGFASPGVDEVVLVTDVIAALRIAAAEAKVASDLPDYRAIAAFHVGITRVEGDDLRGSAVNRVSELVRDLTPTAAPPDQSGTLLVVGISADLFDDISNESGFFGDWVQVAAARAWCRSYGVGESVSGK
jgi:hypothetical protein